MVTCHIFSNLLTLAYGTHALIPVPYRLCRVISTAQATELKDKPLETPALIVPLAASTCADTQVENTLPQTDTTAPQFPHQQSQPSLFDKICTSYPYGKLSDICVTGPASVTASFVPEQELGYDLGHQGVSTAELLRHMGVLGSMVGALVNPAPGRHYYLAVGGTLTSRRCFESEDGRALATEELGPVLPVNTGVVMCTMPLQALVSAKITQGGAVI